MFVTATRQLSHVLCETFEKGGELPPALHRVLCLFGLINSMAGISVLVYAAWLRSCVEDTVMLNQFVSSLGWGANGASVWFTFGASVVGLNMLVFAAFIAAWLRRTAEPANHVTLVELTRAAVDHFIVATMGLWVLAWFVDIRTPDFTASLVIVFVHSLGAAVFFYNAIRGSMLLSNALAVSGQPHQIQKALAQLGAVVAVVMGISIVPLMVVGYQAELFQPLMHNHWDLSVQERLQMVSAVSNAFPLTAMLEWVAVMSFFLWFLVTGVQMFFRKMP